MKAKVILALLVAMSWGAMCAPGAALATPAEAASCQLSIQPPSLGIGTFYAGKQARFSGEVAENQEVILEISGPREDVTFDLKGRVGPFWMNRGLVHVENAPTLYILLLPQPAPAEAELKALELGMGHLKQAIPVSSPGQDADQLFASFWGFKEAAGLYQQKPGAVTYAPAGPGRRRFEALFDFPASLVAGEYQVRATILQGGAVQARQGSAYQVQDEAFLKFIKDLAQGSALLFGVLCVVIALVTGGVMGVVFKGGKGGH